MKEILQFDLITTSSLFDDDMTSKSHKPHNHART